MKFQLLLFLFFTCFTTLAQVPNLKFEHIGTDAGLSQSNVTCILQDHNGFMWFGTRDGLNKYDGYKFTVYRNDFSDENSLSNNFISDLVEDREGNLWIATYGGGLNLYIPSEQKFVHYKHKENNGYSILNDYINSLLLDSRGSLWVGTDKGLDAFDIKNKVFVHYTHEPGNAHSL